MRFAEEHNNMFAFALGAINRYYFFLRTTYERHRTASNAYVDNTTAFRATVLPGVHQLDAEQLRLSEEARILSLTVQMELETFYIFPKVLLDKLAQAIGFYFGPARGCLTSSPDDLSKSIRTYAALKGLVLPESLVEEMEHLRTDVADFRDKQISHEKSPRTTRPMLIERDVPSE